MPAKWQQWMPLQIDKWRGSPAVRAMHPAARSGYLDLLIAQWQTEDCTLPSDPLDLAELSGLGDELWAAHGARILRNFEMLANGRLRNFVCFEEWQEAKKVFDKRSASAHRTNSARSPHGHRTVTDDIAQRSADTTVVPVVVSVPVSQKENPLDETDVMRRVGEECRITDTEALREICEQARLELADGRTANEVAADITASIKLYQQEKPNLRITWGLRKFIGEGHWRDPRGWPRKESRGDDLTRHRREMAERLNQAEAT